MTDEKLMQIQGMTCAHCEKTIAEALTGAGADKVEVSWRKGEAVLDANGVADDQLKAVVEEAGYRVLSLEGRPRHGKDFEVVVGEGRHDYDLVVLGSGSAAFAAAIHATDAGYKAALMEMNTVGGTCVNVGCVPSKAMLAPADAYYRAGHHPFAGIQTSANGFDLTALVDSKAALVDQLRAEKYLDLAKEYGFTICEGRAEFIDGATIECGGRRITARHFIVATGAAPAVPPIPGLKEAGYLTSTTALELKTPPKELVVIGANAIGLEMGQLFLHLGSKVTFIEAMSRITPLEEPEVSETMQAILEEQGARVIIGAKVTSVSREGSRRTVTFQLNGSEQTVAADHILVATGRRPNTAGLALEKAGVELTERGAVKVDASLRTANPRIWAAGDVAGHPQFVYVAAYEGNMAARNALENEGLTVDFRSLPRVIFTTPQVAGAGLTDEQASQQGIECECRVLPMAYVPRALVNRDTRGFVKIVAERATGRIVGATAVADDAGDVIQAAIYAIQFGLTTDDVANTWAPYLTFAEAFKLAAQTFKRDVSKLSCCAA
jgi:mercuric reductase